LSLSGKRKLARSVSFTTRKPRKGERQGRDYFFISRPEFLKRRNQRQFLEWARVLGNFYGTPRAFVKRHLSRGDDVLLSIDVQGARKIRGKIRKAVFIFILPPSCGELARRLQARSTEKKREISRRLKLAKREMRFIKEYDYVVLNDKVSKALARLKEIINIERKR
jgi:guanylate kinase